MELLVIWFSDWSPTPAGIVPEQAGSQLEDRGAYLQLREILSSEYSIHLDAFIPVLESGEALPVQRLISAARCLEVLNEGILEDARARTFTCKDEFGFVRTVEGTTISSWLEGYRILWKSGYFLLRRVQSDQP